MNGFNLSNISNCCIGSAEASAIYYGSNIVWQRDPEITEYLWFNAPLQAVTLNIASSLSNTTTLEYSTNKINWNTINISSGGTSSITLNKNQKLYFRAELSATGQDSSHYLHFNINIARIDIGGNIMSLIYGSNFIGKTILNVNYEFYGLFINSTYLINASALRLPATTLTNYCYQNMFSGCTRLVNASFELPAEWVRYYSYNGMFNGCSSLTSPPDLSAATKLDGYAFSNMFSSCTSLSVLPDFSNVNIITYWAPWRYTFSGCTSIVDARYNINNKRFLPTNLTVTSGGSAYEFMFNGCKNLQYAPELTEISPHAGEYNNMFNGCTSLYTIYTHATSIGTNYFSSIVKNTGHIGTVYKAKNVTWDTTQYSQFNSSSSVQWSVIDGDYNQGDYQT